MTTELKRKSCNYEFPSNKVELTNMDITEEYFKINWNCPKCGQKFATTILTPSLLTTPKPKLSNSFELFITGPKANIQKQYEMFSYILAEHGERVHGSQRDSDSQTGLIGLPLYYKIPQGQGGEVKQKFDNIRNQIVTR